MFKTGAHVFPVVQRQTKGDPFQPPAGSFARRAAALRETGAALVFGDVTGSVSGVLSAGSAVWDPEAEPEAGFVPVPDLGLTTGSGSAASTGEGSADLTGDGETERRYDGSTPPVPRAVALSSTTPAPADAIPIEVAAASLALPDFAIRPERPGILQSVPEDASRRYADLIDPESLDKEQRCPVGGGLFRGPQRIRGGSRRGGPGGAQPGGRAASIRAASAVSSTRTGIITWAASSPSRARASPCASSMPARGNPPPGSPAR